MKKTYKELLFNVISIEEDDIVTASAGEPNGDVCGQDTHWDDDVEKW